ncbi:hypothetical protein ABPG75_000146 [Micractinium tetrahymenae]
MAAGLPTVPAPGATFWSGTCGAQWRLGQRISASDIATATAAAAGAGDEGAGAKRSGARSGVTLAQLVQAAVVQPGQGVITVSYKGASYTASLNAAGAIEYEGHTFVSPTAFSIHVKRKQTPGKAGDDGWVSVHCLGRPLAEYRRGWRMLLTCCHPYLVRVRKDYVEQRGGSGGGGRQQQGAAGPAAAAATAAAAAPAPRAVPGRSSRGRQRRKSSRYSESDDDGAAAGMEVDGLVDIGGPSPLKIDGDLVVDLPPGVEVPGCDEWVQCDRCEVWRLVPGEWAQAVRDDTRQEWLCEYAQWDVASQPPHKPACDAGGGGTGTGGSKRRGKRR